MPNLTLLHNHFEQEHLGKDVFLVPLTIGRLYGWDVVVAHPRTTTNEALPREIRGARRVPLGSTPMSVQEGMSGHWWLYVRYILTHARQMDALMMFHLVGAHLFWGVLYKALNPRGRLYVKVDGWTWSVLQWLPAKPRSPRVWLLKKLADRFVDRVDLLTVEAHETVGQIAGHPVWGARLRDKVRWLPNRFDSELFDTMAMPRRDLAAKERLVITVGRLGDHAKNTELLLAALERLRWAPEWKVALVGGLEPGFRATVDAWFERNPHLVERVSLPGAFYDKGELWQWYDRARVFVLTSRSESYANVFLEAANFRNHIVSTPVSGAADVITELDGYGELVAQEDVTYLTQTLEKVMADGYLESQYPRVRWDRVDVSWERGIRDAMGDFWTVP